MSIFVEGSQVLSVSFRPSNRSVLSMRFLDSLPATSRIKPLLVTTVGQHHPISFPLSFEVSGLSSTDLVLGLDWAAFLRDSLLGLGYCVDSSFDAWRFVSDPTHPILNGNEHDSVAIYRTFPIRAALNPGPSIATSSRIPDTYVMLVALLTDHVNIYPAKDLFSDLEILPKGTLITLALAHGLTVPDDANCTTLRNSIATHIGMGLCTLRDSAFAAIACSSIIAQPDTLIAPETVDDPATRLQLYIMHQIAPVLTSRALRRLLDMHGVRYATTDKTSKLRRHLLSFLHRLDRRKGADVDITSLGSERIARRQELKRLRTEWPQVVPDHLKRKLVRNFNLGISGANLATFACGSCNELCPITEKNTLSFEDFDLDVLRRPDHLDTGESDMDVDSDQQSSPDSRTEPWLDSRYPEPPMPMQNSPYASLLIEPHSIESDPDSAEPGIAVCRRCCRDLKANKVPPLSTANNNYLGPVPLELKDLTIVEEAMISLCRAKCWIVQLRGDDEDTKLPTTQRGVHGHIIIYPQKPTAIATTLPPPIADIITPICVIFVGSKPPTADWLKNKATPLIVKEKVQNALRWLKAHNRGRKPRVILTERTWAHNTTVMINTSALTEMKETANGGDDDRDVRGPMLGARIRDLMRCAVVMQIEDRSRSECKGNDVYHRIYRLKANVTERIYDKSDLLYF
ncbi:hypothetical protein B0H13DRAFT_2305858 [Mycena leptocephala]|nr:hypothetical protein B0H13DRAFT_2305858 [Mycena leptocephala]